MANDRHPRASRLEIIGAWLHIWTPPRDSYVPPIPVWRLLALTAAAVAAVAALAVAVAGWKERSQERERRAAAAADARRRSELAREQAPHRARVVAAAAASAPPREQPGLRRQVVGELELAITADAQRRYDQRLLPSRVDHTTCVPYVRPPSEHPPEPPLTATRAKYECLGVSSKIVPTASTPPGELGYPFWARVDFRRGRIVWCKVNPRAAERGIGGDLYVPLQRDCDLRRG